MLGAESLCASPRLWQSPNSTMFLSSVFKSGADGSRTHCLLHAMQALYQLSYSPSELLTISGGAGLKGLAITLHAHG